METREEFLSCFALAEEKLAFEKGVLLFQRSALSSALLREKLERKGFCSEVAEKVVTRLLELALLCDESFAEAAARKYGKKYGNMRLRFELQRKKVAPSAIEELAKRCSSRGGEDPLPLAGTDPERAKREDASLPLSRAARFFF